MQGALFYLWLQNNLALFPHSNYERIIMNLILVGSCCRPRDLLIGITPLSHGPGRSPKKTRTTLYFPPTLRSPGPRPVRGFLQRSQEYLKTSFHLPTQTGGLLLGHTDFSSFKRHANHLLPLHQTTWNCGAGGPFIHALEP